MSYYAIIDTNVIVSALIKAHEDSATCRTILEIFNKTIIPVYSKEIIVEYSEVLSRGKFKNKFTVKAANRMIQAIIDNGIECSGIQTEETSSDQKDVIFYEVTMDARQEHDARLVTGNTKHFPVKPFIVTPAEMMLIIEENRKKKQ